MSRIVEKLNATSQAKRAALIAYFCAGDPSLQATEELVVAAAESGADIIELGVPFSDPMADGPAIQRASERALRGGTTLRKVLEVAARIRSRTDVPLVLFGYYNPILAYGESELFADAKVAGIDGVLIVDLPLEESHLLQRMAQQQGLDWIPLIAPTSGDERVARAMELTTGFAYYVSMTGVTGAEVVDLTQAAERAQMIRRKFKKPIALGFGIKSASQVAALAHSVDAVVVGSAIVSCIEEAGSTPVAIDRVRHLISDLAAGTASENFVLDLIKK